MGDWCTSVINSGKLLHRGSLFLRVARTILVIMEVRIEQSQRQNKSKSTTALDIVFWYLSRYFSYLDCRV